MSRLTNAILQNTNAFAKGTTAPMLDLQNGGQMGHAPDYTEWVSHQAYARRNLITLLIEAPKLFQSLPNPEYWTGTLRSLVELHAMTVTGLQAGLEVEYVENAFGGAGQMHEDFVNVKEARSIPVFKFHEKYGMPVHNFLRGWITNLLMDPYTKFAGITTNSTGAKPTDLLADQYSATMMFIEPDPTHQFVQKAWLCTNMAPRGTGELIGARDLTQDAEPISYDITFTAITQYGLGVNAFAQKLLEGINRTGANPYLRQAFVDSISADILAAKKSYSDGVTTLAGAAIKV